MGSKVEVWIDLEEASGYQVSSLGRFRSLNRTIPCISRSGNLTTRYLTGRILATHTDKKGYSYIRFGRNSKRYKVHRLVAKYFLEEPDNDLINECNTNGVEVNHIDGDKGNNSTSNLEWCTNKQNMMHAKEKGLMNKPIGVKNPNQKLTESEVLEIRQRKSAGEYAKDICDDYSISISMVYKICDGSNWSHI